MSLADTAAALLFVGVVVYAVFGGADFGSGIWDLLAGDAETRRRPAYPDRPQHRAGVGGQPRVAHLRARVHVDRVPTAFAAMITTLAIPWMLVGLGIILRGAGFAFRKFAATLGQARLYGAAFAASSVITPFFLGMIAGAIASGRVPMDGGDVWRSWTGPTSWVGGALAVLTCSFLAATFLAADASRAGNQPLAHGCARRAIVAGLVSGAVALGAVLPLERDADHLADGLQSRASPLIVLSAIAGVQAMFDLWRGRYQRPASAQWWRSRRWSSVGVSVSTPTCSSITPRSPKRLGPGPRWSD